MRSRLSGLALLTALGAGLPVLGAAPIEGEWLTQEGEARVRIGACRAGELCGHLVWIRDPPADGPALDVHNPDPELRERPILGLQLIEDLPARPDEDGVYRGGRIYDPESGKTYRCKVRLAADGRLELRGFFGISLLGRTTRWTRVATGHAATAAP